MFQKTRRELLVNPGQTPRPSWGKESQTPHQRPPCVDVCVCLSVCLSVCQKRSEDARTKSSTSWPIRPSATRPPMPDGVRRLGCSWSSGRATATPPLRPCDTGTSPCHRHRFTTEGRWEPCDVGTPWVGPSFVPRGEIAPRRGRDEGGREGSMGGKWKTTGVRVWMSLK